MQDHKQMQQAVCELLVSHAKNEHARLVVAPKIAETSLMMNHLYHDLGFQSRTQMGTYMKEHFPTLAAIKPAQTLWKKFLYDSIDAVAPACAGCSDADTCFKCIIAEASA